MFEWLKYKTRLRGVRKELVEIGKQLNDEILDGLDVELKPVKTGQAVRKIAAAVSSIAKILVRVIDSLPGEDLSDEHH